jgi:hypothetical protein
MIHMTPAGSAMRSAGPPRRASWRIPRNSPDAQLQLARYGRLVYHDIHTLDFTGLTSFAFGLTPP